MLIAQDYSVTELVTIFEGYKQPKFRAKQLFEWLNKGADFEDMSNIPKTFIAEFEKHYIAQAVKIYDKRVSKIDGTCKYLFKLQDENIIEGVLMKYSYGYTLCISTQVGCRMNCSFCASGLDGMIRNLSAGEILGQVVSVNKSLSKAGERVITNVVLMGSGEPLDNYDNVIKFLQLVNSENGLNISKRNISLSTCGIVPKILTLANDASGVTLTISLHAPYDELRDEIMPINKKYNITDLIDASMRYFKQSGRRVIFEYSLINGKNDDEYCARKLTQLLRGLPCHVNLISLNFVKEKGLKGSCNKNVQEFLAILTENNISATLRRTMGSDIEGACGQLRRSVINPEE